MSSNNYSFQQATWFKLLYIVCPIAIFVILFGSALFLPDFYRKNFIGELSIVEHSHIAIPLVGTVLAIILFFKFLRLRMAIGMCFAAASLLICLYIAGEEASYGQHIIGWEAGDYFAQNNKQNETNVHNMSSWFNQKPRVILEIAIIAGGLLLPVFPQYLMRFVPSGLRPFAPSLYFVPLAVLVLIPRAPARLGFADAIGLGKGMRTSEVQEVFLYSFIALYLLYVLRIIQTGEWRRE